MTPEPAPAHKFADLGPLGQPVKHILTHKRIEATFQRWQAPDERSFQAYAEAQCGLVMSWDEFGNRPRPRLLTKIWEKLLHQTGIVELH